VKTSKSNAPSRSDSRSFVPTLVITCALAGLLFGLAWLVLRNPVQVMQRDSTAADGPCARPSSLFATSDRSVELATLGVGQVSLGKFHVEQKPEVFEALQASSRDAQATEYLICMAIQRGDVQQGNVEQIGHLRSFLSFMQTSPTSDQLAAWQKDNPTPVSRD